MRRHDYHSMPLSYRDIIFVSLKILVHGRDKYRYRTTFERFFCLQLFHCWCRDFYRDYLLFLIFVTTV